MGKEERVIEYLLSQTYPVKVNDICKELDVSRRSVYNYLEKLKNDPSFEVIMGKDGVLINRIGEDNKDKKKPGNYEERRNFIYRKGLIMQRNLSIDHLLEYFAVSEATFHQDIIKIRKEIRKYGIKLVTKNGKLFFNGNYHNLKRLTQSVIYNENDTNSLLSVDTLTEVFPNFDVKFVKDSIDNALKNNNLFMDEYSLANLLLHIVISMNQELNGIYPNSGELEFNHKEVVDEICRPIEYKYSFTFSSSSKLQFSLMLYTRAKNEEANILENLKNKESIDIVDEIFNKLYESYNLDMLHTGSLKDSFCLHIDSLISRLKSGITVKNPLYTLIKSNSPITYDLAIFAANIITTRTSYQLSESEIAYIALHIGARLEEIRSARDRLKVIIVCPEYYLYNSNLQKISQIYNEDIYVDNVYTSFDDVKDTDIIDFCICTVLPNRDTGLRTLRVGPFLTKEDRENIQETVNYIKKQKRNDKNRDVVKALFDKRIFFNNIEFETKEEAIHFICDNLVKANYVSNDFEEALVNREVIAPTDFGSIAIPHPVDYSANKTAISVVLLNKPVHWHNNDVTIIFTIAMNNNDFEVFEDVFSSLISITSDNDKVGMLLSSEDYDDFVKKIVNMLYS